MDPTLKSILNKVNESSLAPELDATERAYLDLVLGRARAEPGEHPAPLHRLVRRQCFLQKGIFHASFDPMMDPILVAAGASPECLQGGGFEPRKVAPVTRDGLERAVRRHLAHVDPNLRAHATRLVGLAELHGVLDLVVDSLESGREERMDWGAPVIAASLETLTMLRHPKARSFALRYLAHDDWGVRTSAQATVLAAAGAPSREELERVFETQLEPMLLDAVPDAFVAGAANGALQSQKLEEMLERLPLYFVSTASAVADVIVTGGFRELFAKVLRASGHLRPLRAALAARVAWTDETWAIQPLRECLEDELDPDPRMCLVTSLLTLEHAEPDEGAVRARLTSADPSEILGGVWATLGTDRYARELERLRRDASPQVRRAAGAALAASAKTPDPDHLEVAWTDLLNNEDAWWPWGLALRGLSALGLPVPLSAQVFRHVSRDAGRLAGAGELEEVLALVREHPLQLMRWIRADSPDDQRIRAIELAGLAGGGLFDSALEDALLSAHSFLVASAAALEVVSGAGPSSDIVALRAEMAISDPPRVRSESLAPAVFAMSGDGQLRQRATQCLGSLGAEVEPILALLMESTLPEVARTAAELVAARREPPESAHLRDVSLLLNGEARQMQDLKCVERLVTSMSPRVRAAICELGALPEVSRGDVMRLFPFLLADRDEDVAAAALGALAIHASELAWVKDLVLAQTWSPDWRTRDRAILAMAQIADVKFVPRMLEIVEGPEGRDAAVRGLEKLAEMRPELGFVVLDIREPERVATRFGLNARLDYSAERSTEALRMLLLGLDRRWDLEQAKKHAGRKVMLTRVDQEDAMHATSGWSGALFDALAMGLRVVYTDDESGAIVAEVSEDPSGEVLNALLQSTEVAVRRVAWS